MGETLTTPGLAVLKGPSNIRFFPLPTNLTTVGRSEEADVQLTNDDSISRIHMEVRLDGGRYVLVNCSDNGTLVNDRLAEERPLCNGDRIRVGEAYVLEFREGGPMAASVRPSIFRRPGLIAFCALYGVAMIALFVFLAGKKASTNQASSQQIRRAVEEQTQYLVERRVPKAEHEAAILGLERYLRAALIAEREGNFRQTRDIYLGILDYTRDGRSPAYQYALERLRSLPASEE